MNMNGYYFAPYMYDGMYKTAVTNYEQLKEMYPGKIKGLLMYVELEIDKYEYFGSFIYDEMPDKLRINEISKKIYEKQLESDMFKEEEKDMLMMIIEMLVCNEIYMRKANKVKRYF